MDDDRKGSDTFIIEDENDDHLYAHHYIDDRPEAPFAQEILMEEASNEETESPFAFGVKSPEIKVSR